MRRLPLTTRLNLWYGAVLVLTVLLAVTVAELTGRYLETQRRVARIERVHERVRQIYISQGPQAVRDVEIPGYQVTITQTETTSPWYETHSQVAEHAWLYTSIPPEIVQETQQDARIALIGGGIFALLLASIGGHLVTRRALRPIEDVARTAAQIVRHGDTGARVPSPQTHDELDRMVTLFNQVLDSNAQIITTMRHSLDSIGHDLRTPLTRIQASAELGLRNPGDAEDALETCLEEAQNTEHLLTALLDLTRAEAGMLPLNKQPVVLADLVDRTLSLYEHVANQQQVQLSAESFPRISLSVDPTRVQQALANLIDNAIKFTPSGGRVQLTPAQRPGAVGIQISDTGCGIPPADLPHVFKRLYRADRSRSTPGSGLGLAMVRAIAEAHGGSVELQSTEGSGTTATLWLPTDPARRS